MIFLIILSGCTVVKKREEIGILREFSKEQAAQEKVIERETKRYEKCVKAIEDGRIRVGTGAAAVLELVGEPVVSERMTDGIK